MLEATRKVLIVAIVAGLAFIVLSPPVAVTVLGIALIPALVAGGKGRDPWAWWGFSAVLLPVGLVAAFVIRDERRRCDFCDEPVRPGASVCPHCQRELVAAG